jgi:aquaporin Z
MSLGIRRIIAEVIGTAALVFMGCAAAMTNGFGIGFVGIALVFGLVLTAMAYSIGNVSGAHINPAVSLGMLISRRISGGQFIQYLIAQIVGAFIGACLLRTIFGRSFIQTHGMGQNFFGAGQPINLSAGGAFALEVILTFIFVITVLGVTAKHHNRAIAGLAVGGALALVHLIGLPLTGTSVNPARSLAPAVFVGGTALNHVWLFLLAPLVGAALAALAYNLIAGHKHNAEEVAVATPAPAYAYATEPATTEYVEYVEPVTTTYVADNAEFTDR